MPGFSDVFSAPPADQPSDPLAPEPVVYDNPDSPDDRGPGDPVNDDNNPTGSTTDPADDQGFSSASGDHFDGGM